MDKLLTRMSNEIMKVTLAIKKYHTMCNGGGGFILDLKNTTQKSKINLMFQNRPQTEFLNIANALFEAKS